MARLIDADTIFDGKLLMVRAEAYDAVHAVIEKINNAPTVDAVPVVRCKDCQFFHKYGFKLEYTECTHFDCDVTEDGYCWWGERREDEAD